jgi:hypothetical protein
MSTFSIGRGKNSNYDNGGMFFNVSWAPRIEIVVLGKNQCPTVVMSKWTALTRSSIE